MTFYWKAAAQWTFSASLLVYYVVALVTDLADVAVVVALLGLPVFFATKRLISFSIMFSGYWFGWLQTSLTNLSLACTPSSLSFSICLYSNSYMKALANKRWSHSHSVGFPVKLKVRFFCADDQQVFHRFSCHIMEILYMREGSILHIYKKRLDSE